jgi:hypothetical protein
MSIRLMETSKHVFATSMKHELTPKEAVWNALLELEPKLAPMEEPDVPRLTDKFLEELRVSGFVLVSSSELERLKGVEAEKSSKRLRRPVKSEASS